MPRKPFLPGDLVRAKDAWPNLYSNVYSSPIDSELVYEFRPTRLGLVLTTSVWRSDGVESSFDETFVLVDGVYGWCFSDTLRHLSEEKEEDHEEAGSVDPWDDGSLCSGL